MPGVEVGLRGEPELGPRPRDVERAALELAEPRRGELGLQLVVVEAPARRSAARTSSTEHSRPVPTL